MSDADCILLSSKLEKLISNNDKISLQKELALNMKFVHDANDKELFRTYIEACVFAQEYNLAIIFLDNNKKYYKRFNELQAVMELTGMLHYSMKNYASASKSFKYVITPKYPNISVLCNSISLLELGIDDIDTHKLKLDKILPTSHWANTILGTLYYNNSQYIDATDYFVPAVILSKHSERTRLDFLRSLYNIDKTAAENHFSEFFYDTRSKLSSENLLVEMNKKNITIPALCINPFHLLVKHLLV